MLIHRCPWCGEELSILPKTKCPVCKNSITAYRNKEKGIPKSGILFLLILCFLFFPFRYPFAIIDLPLWADLIHYIILDVIVLCLLGSSPYRRGYVKQNNSNCIQKNQICASISWEAHKNEGLLCPKLQVPNGEIFSAYQVDGHIPICCSIEFDLHIRLDKEFLCCSVLRSSLGQFESINSIKICCGCICLIGISDDGESRNKDHGECQDSGEEFHSFFVVHFLHSDICS